MIGEIVFEKSDMTNVVSRFADVVIIGGGLSGTLLAVQLLRQPRGQRIVIIEPRPELGRGEAYSATELGHTLNGNAARMSVDPDNADDLTQWLTQFIDNGGWPESAEQNLPVAELFPPRGIFGLYAQQRLAEARALGLRYGSTAEHVQAEAIDVQTHGEQVEVTLDEGQVWFAPHAVLATGMFPAARTAVKAPGGLNAAAIDPWDVQTMRTLDPQAQVLIIGSGLTMVDAVVSLDRAGHRGPITVISRHGLWPHVRRQPPAWPDFLAAASDLRSPRQLMAEVRNQCRQALQQGVDWQAPLDTVRVHIARLWSQASERQKRQFVRHVRPWWESHHHRSPPPSDALLQKAIAERRLTLQAACYLSAEGTTLTIRRRGESAPVQLHGDVLINSSGIEYDWRRVDKPLPRQLLARGLVKPGPLALGLLADDEGALLDSDGIASRRLFAMGPPLRGMWWESTAVTDVAAQSKRLAATLLESD